FDDVGAGLGKPCDDLERSLVVGIARRHERDEGGTPLGLEIGETAVDAGGHFNSFFLEAVSRLAPHIPDPNDFQPVASIAVDNVEWRLGNGKLPQCEILYRPPDMRMLHQNLDASIEITESGLSPLRKNRIIVVPPPRKI